jgi:hypothetical protein
MAQWVKILMVIGVILSTAYIYCNYKTVECTTSINEQTYAAFGQYILAIDARLADQTEEYEDYVSQAQTKLETYRKLNSTRQFWAGIGPVFLIGALLSNLVALILALSEKKKE